MPIKDITGEKFNMLTALWYSHSKKNKGQYWCFLCDCGNKKIQNRLRVTKGEIVSCGCYVSVAIKAANFKHGLTKHPLYRIWASIKSRCENKAHDLYPRYGGAGVKISPEWVNSPESFIKWALEEGWRKGMHIDKDIKANKLNISSKIYSKEMCSVVTPLENSACRVSSRYFEHNGVVKTLSAWAREYGIDRHVFGNRIRNGWPFERAIKNVNFNLLRNKK